MLQRVSFWWTVHIDERGGGLHRLCRTEERNEISMKKILAIVLSLTLALSLAACTGSGASSSAPAPSAAPSASAVRPVSTASANSEYYYPVTLEVYNNARELVPYTFEQCPERTLVYGKNNVEIMLALGLEDKILMTADCSSVLPEYEEAAELTVKTIRMLIFFEGIRPQFGAGYGHRMVFPCSTLKIAWVTLAFGTNAASALIPASTAC